MLRHLNEIDLLWGRPEAASAAKIAEHNYDVHAFP
jgi:hypothetical protein